MTEKIIRHGVDVSKCEFRNNTYFSPCGGCENDDNCYFKQLQRKTVECEKYEQLFDEFDKRVSNCIEIYDCIIVSKIVKDIINKAKGINVPTRKDSE